MRRMPKSTSLSRGLALILAVSTVLAGAGCQATKPLVVPPPILAAETPAQTRAAILEALIESDYEVLSDKPGEIVARYGEAEWNMVVAVDYANEIGVRYVSSEELSYGSKNGVLVIHPGYNKRVKDLAKEIAQEVAMSRATSPLPPVAAPPPAEVRTE
jgi:hypothetical protein